MLRLADQPGRGWGSFKEYFPLTPQAFLLHFAGGWLLAPPLEFWILSSGGLAPRCLRLSALSGPTQRPFPASPSLRPSSTAVYGSTDRNPPILAAARLSYPACRREGLGPLK